MITQVQRLARARTGLASAGAVVAAATAFATVGAPVASAKTHPVKKNPTHKTHHKKTKGSGKTTTMHVKPKVTEVNWGTAPATPEQPASPVELYTLHGAGGMKVNISEFGADIQSIDVPNKNGGLTDVVLGMPSLADYVGMFEAQYNKTNWPIPTSTSGSGDTYFGGTIGQYANRIANGTFSLNGKNYVLDQNNGVNDLHGGYLGWNTHVWSGTPSVSGSTAQVSMSASFPAGTGCDLTLTPGCTGFPTPMNATVTFSVQKNNTLSIGYSATNESSTLQTVINLTNHSYYNLGGQGSGVVDNQLLAMNANAYQPTNNVQIPVPGTNNSYFQNVKGTAFDFEKMHAIGQNIANIKLPDGTSGPIRQLQYAHGYDFNWVLNGQGKYRLDAVAQDLKTGITMWQYTDQPGLQLYTANYLQGDDPGVTGNDYRQTDAFTLETQHYPDSPHHIGQAGWPSVVVDPGQTFTSKTAMHFGIEGANFAKTINFR